MADGSAMMKRFKFPVGVSLLVAVLAVGFTLRYLAAIENGVSHSAALRTYAFWALMLAPVAYLADIVIRTVLEYRIVRLVVARVQANRRR